MEVFKCDFSDIEVSTRTFIIFTNLKNNLTRLFDFLEVAEDVSLPRRRRKKRDPNFVYPPSGTIVGAKIGWRLRGVDVKRRTTEVRCRSFRNAIMISMVSVDTILNLKLCNTGSIHCTGCRTDEQLETALVELWRIIEKSELYEFTRGEHLEVLFVPVMRNVDFNIGFNVDREKLLNLIENSPKYKDKMIVSNYMQTDVNIKMLIDKNVADVNITKMSCSTDGKWMKETTKYAEYLNLLTERDRKSKLNKSYYVTFMVFHSGTIILTAINEDYARPYFYEFLDFVIENEEDIREVIN